MILRYRPESDLTVMNSTSASKVDRQLTIGGVEGNYIMDNKQALSEDASNFMGEAYITWLIDPMGSLRLRGFTQTVDRCDENQGSQRLALESTTERI